jgi:hypothetical protein
VDDGACCNDGFGDDWQGVDPFLCSLHVEQVTREFVNKVIIIKILSILTSAMLTSLARSMVSGLIIATTKF